MEPIAYILPALAALFAWWFSTGVVLCLVGLPRWTHPWSAAGASVLLVAALYGLWDGQDDATAGGAYRGFAYGLLVWAWHEVVFLLGYVTGPNQQPRPGDSHGFDRFARAFGTVYHHEVAILVTALLVVALTWDGANPYGAWTFLLLWGMRLSAKLNVFLGVPNLTEEFLPDHLGHLQSHFKKAPINLLFPVSITAATLLVGGLAQGALTGTGAHAVTGLALLAALAALGLLEHWFMVLPLPDVVLWRWALRTRTVPPPPKAVPPTVRQAVWRSS